MVGTLADGIHARVIGLQGVIDQDAAVTGNAGSFGQRAVGSDTGGHHHQIGVDDLVIGKAHGLDPTGFVADQLGGLLFHLEAQAAAFQGVLQEGAGRLIELALHRPFTDVHNRDVHAAQLQTVGGFQPKQSATDYHGVLVGLGSVHHRLRVSDVAITDHALQIIAGNWQDEGIRPCGDQQSVIFRLAAILSDHTALDPVDLDHLAVQHQADVVVGVPLEIVEHDLLEGLLSGQHRGEQDSVVVGMRLGTEHGDVVKLGGKLEQLFQGAYPGHAVADHHQLEFLHAVLPLDRAVDSCLPCRCKNPERKKASH